MLLKSVRLLTIVIVALCLVPAGAHFFELASKMSLSPAAYMTVQKILCWLVFFRNSNYHRAPAHLDPHVHGTQ
jgi:hypothetical protein